MKEQLLDLYYKIRWPIVNYGGDIIKGRRLKWWIQRRRRGFDDRELWSLDYTFAEFAAPRLRELAKRIHGCPTDLVKNDDVDKACMTWQRHINMMARAFELIVLDNDDIDYSDVKMVEVGKTKFGTKIKIVVDEEKDKLRKRVEKERQEEMDEGLELFHKFFRNLWD